MRQAVSVRSKRAGWESSSRKQPRSLEWKKEDPAVQAVDKEKEDPAVQAVDKVRGVGLLTATAAVATNVSVFLTLIRTARKV